MSDPEVVLAMFFFSVIALAILAPKGPATAALQVIRDVLFKLLK